MPRTDNRSRSPSRNRRFDDDEPFGGRPSFGARVPRAPDAFSGLELGGTVKWFNAEKGFGFVVLSDGSGDAFLHGSVLSRAGYDSVGEGAILKVRVGQGQKGPQITEVLSVEPGSAPPPSSSRPSFSRGGMDRGDRGPSGPSTEMNGTVKWYNATKGFGFVTSESGGKDVFVHASVLTRSGLQGLQEGQPVRMQVRQGMKGPEAVSLDLA